MTRLVILDRDGVINYDSIGYVKSPAEWQAIPGSLEAIGYLKKAGLSIAVATNQSGIGRGLYTEDILKKIHNKMTYQLSQLGVSIDFIAFCPHTAEDNCNCRKPKTGMLQQITHHLDIEPTASIFIGDSLKDIDAALAHGCHPILVQTGNGMNVAGLLQEQNRIIDVFPDLASAAQHILTKLDNDQ